MVSLRSLLGLTVAASAVAALPTGSDKGAAAHVYDAAAAARAQEKRAPRALLDRLERKRAARLQLLASPAGQEALAKRKAPASKDDERKPLPIVDYQDLDATSSKSGGLNYTGYKNPLPANKPGSDPHYVAFSAFDWHSLNCVYTMRILPLLVKAL